MGYYTKYELTTDDGIDHKEGVELASGYCCLFEDTRKWYRHEEDMKSYSKDYPNTIFRLEGEGEESGDLWVKYFKGGLMQSVRAEIIFKPFDESLLE